MNEIWDAYRLLLQHGLAVSGLDSSGPPPARDEDSEVWWQSMEHLAAQDGLLVEPFLRAGAAHVFVAPALILRAPDGSSYHGVRRDNGDLRRRIRRDWGEKLARACARHNTAQTSPIAVLSREVSS